MIPGAGVANLKDGVRLKPDPTGVGQRSQTSASATGFRVEK
ncbi:hypothetical protein BH20ACT13_BH20ACT13_09570 [soil metagenome]